MMQMTMAFRDRVPWRIICGALIRSILGRRGHGSTVKRN
jgi:hypothetical protein